MFDWLFEGRTSVYILLAITVVGLVYVGRQLRRRSLFVAAGVAVAFLVLYFLLYLFVETDRKQVRRKLQEMAAAVATHDTDRILAHVSTKFQVQGMDRAAFRKYVDAALHNGSVDELKLWDIEFPKEETPAEEGTLKVAFQARPKSGRYPVTPPFLCDAVFVRDPDGEWRMKEFKVYNPLLNSYAPLELPR